VGAQAFLADNLPRRTYKNKGLESRIPRIGVIEHVNQSAFVFLRFDIVVQGGQK